MTQTSNVSRVQNAGVIFSKWEDLLYFICPIVLCWMLLVWKKNGMAPSTLVAIMFVKNFLDNMHLGSTVHVAIHRAQMGHLSRAFVYSSPLLILVAGSILSIYQFSLLSAIFLYWSLFHFVRQQYGFVMMSRAKASESEKTRWVDALFTYHLVLYPFIFLHSSAFEIESFMGAKLAFHAGAKVTEISRIVFWLVNLGYVIYLIASYYREKKLNTGKLVVLANTFLIYYVGIVLLQDFWLWTFSLGLTHALPYVGIVHKSIFTGKFSQDKFKKDWLARLPHFLELLLYSHSHSNRGLHSTRSSVPPKLANLSPTYVYVPWPSPLFFG